MKKTFTYFLLFTAALALVGCHSTKTLKSATAKTTTTSSFVDPDDSTYVAKGPQHVKGQGENMDYRRSSLCSILIRHTEKKYDNDIAAVFPTIPIPEKYNDHNLGVRTINSKMVRKNSVHGKKVLTETVDPFINNQDVAKQLVSKWFNQSSEGTFNMNLVKDRGLYDADWFDEQMADQNVRGRNVLADAGEELIGNTFVIFNDIEYIDKEKVAQGVGTGLRILGAVASIATGGSNIGKNINALARTTASVLDEVAGFRVNITTYLYRLRWDDETSGTFYSQYYTDTPDGAKRSAYMDDKSTFHLDYIGSYKVSSAKTTLGGVKDQHGMIRKVCQRAIDKNVAQLQKEYEEFRVKTPLFSVTPLSAKIGLKEDITPSSKFEVLEEVEDAEGKTRYRRVGVIQPIKGKIWDNRYMAEFEDENKDNARTSTEFKVLSGRGFYPGMLLREIK